MKKSEKKKLQKKEVNIIEHQHKSFVNGKINTHGFPHPVSSQHTNKKTQMVHDITVKIDHGKTEGLNGYDRKSK